MESKNEKLGTQHINSTIEQILKKNNELKAKASANEANDNVVQEQEDVVQQVEHREEKAVIGERTFRMCCNVPQSIHRRIRNYQYSQDVKPTIDEFLQEAIIEYLDKRKF